MRFAHVPIEPALSLECARGIRRRRLDKSMTRIELINRIGTEIDRPRPISFEADHDRFGLLRHGQFDSSNKGCGVKHQVFTVGFLAGHIRGQNVNKRVCAHAVFGKIDTSGSAGGGSREKILLV